MPAAERVFQQRDHAALWFSLGVGLLVMQVGAYLVPAVGTRDALLAIVLGSVLGAGLLAWTARLGCETGLSSSALMSATFGRQWAKLPVLLNIVQLVGWTTFELVVMRDGTSAVAQPLGWSLGPVGPTLLWGGVLLWLLAAPMTVRVRELISRWVLPLVIVSLLWLSWQFGQKVLAGGWSAFWNRAGDGSMGLLAATDLVLAMPVSWLPLVADYARHGQDGRSTLRGTWLGYALANAWCYALGVLIALGVTPGTDLVQALLLAQGGLLALSLILIDEIDNAYGDVYSAAVSATSLGRRLSLRQASLAMALACTGLALVLPMHSLEPFLLTLSSVFIPLYGVIWGRLGAGHAVRADAAGRAGVDWTAAALWLLGIALYQAISRWAPQWGASLPTLALCFSLAWLTRGALRRA